MNTATKSEDTMSENNERLAYHVVRMHGEDGYAITSDEGQELGLVWREDLALRIVRAVNSHDALVEALESLREFFDRLRPQDEAKARAALALAKGE
jgi:hypothetical protein